ncbi:MAG: ABC transporter ATP-binding protein [Bacilli bacterium]
MKKEVIELIDLVKKYDDDTIVNGINLKVYDNEFLTLLGPSGCGKTTTLRMIGGFETPDSGSIIINQKIFNELPPYARPVNTVFQRYALFTHLNVFDNVAFGLNNRGYSYQLNFFGEEFIKSELIREKKEVTNKEIKNKIKDLIAIEVTKALTLVKLAGFEKRKVNQMSGGQQQRVALARAIINRPQILLLDEPLSALDLKLRQNMQYELKEIQKKLGITFIYVTHDQEEAMTMSDRIIVMKDGVIQQMGTPKHIYNEPVNRYVATFIGESNIIPGVYITKDKVRFMNVDFDCMGYNFKDNEAVDVVIRPEDFDVVDMDKAKLIGVVKSTIFKGVHNKLIIDINGVDFEVNTYENYNVGDSIGLKVDPYEIHIMKVNANE